MESYNCNAICKPENAWGGERLQNNAVITESLPPVEQLKTYAYPVCLS